MTDVTMPDGFVWTLIGERWYVAKHTNDSIKLLTWEGACIECGAPFRISTPQRFAHSGDMERRRCPVHKLAPSGWRPRRK